MQGRPKGGKNKYYSKEEKIKIVQEMLKGKTTRDITNEYGINPVSYTHLRAHET